MKINIALPFGMDGPSDDFNDMAGVAEIGAVLEAAGVHAGLVTDHPCPSAAWLNAGGHPAPGPLIMLALLASATTRLRLQTSILVLPYRNPFIVARDVATLDRFAKGRVTLGVGAGYLEDEYRAVGADFDARNAVMDDYLGGLRAALTGADFTYSAEGFAAGGNRITPPPVQQPLPIFIGGNSRRAIRRAVEFGQGWNPFLTGHSDYAASTTHTAKMRGEEDLRAGIAYLHACCAQADRTDALEVELGGVTSPFDSLSHAQLLDRLGRYRDLGVTAASLVVGGRTRTEWCDAVAAIGQAVIAHL